MKPNNGFARSLVGMFLLALFFGGRGFAATGTGNIYYPNWMDNPVIQTVTLTGLDGSGYLQGAAANVTNAVPDIAARAFSSTLNFSYSPKSTVAQRVNFCETMAYYYCTSYDNYMLSLGFGGMAPVSVVVFDGSWYGPTWVPSSSEYDPTQNTIALGSDFSRRYSVAMDEDTIIHEYTHAIQNAIIPGGISQMQTNITATDQARAIMEGYADYGAASFTNDPILMEYTADLWEEGMFVRNVNNFYNWADYSSNPGAAGAYTVGMVFSGALWDLRNVVGAKVADTLALKAVAALPDNDPSTPGLQVSLTTALSIFLQTDASLYNGAHTAAIEQAFAVHGIGTYNFSTPYPMVMYPGNNYNGLQSRTILGAKEVAVTFDQFVTKLDDASFTTDVCPDAVANYKSTVDYLQILDGAGDVIGTYTGTELEGQTIRVPGNTVQFHLVTDGSRASFGYRVVNMWNVADVNNDGAVDATDIDTIYANFTAKTANYNAGCDVNGDGVVDQNDVTYELNHYLNTNYGDANLDGATDFADFQTLLNHWQASGAGVGWAAGDFNGDGTVDFLDYQMLLNYWNPSGWNFSESQAPEPATLLLLGLGGLALLRRRSR